MNMNLIPIQESDAFTDKELQIFEEKYLPVIKNYAEVVKQKKAFEEQEKRFKKELGQVMDNFGIKSMDCPFVKFTRVAAGEDKTTLDIDALKEYEPELYQDLIEDYPKIIKGKSAFVRFDVK